MLRAGTWNYRPVSVPHRILVRGTASAAELKLRRDRPDAASQTGNLTFGAASYRHGRIPHAAVGARSLARHIAGHPSRIKANA